MTSQDGPRQAACAVSEGNMGAVCSQGPDGAVAPGASGKAKLEQPRPGPMSSLGPGRALDGHQPQAVSRTRSGGHVHPPRSAKEAASEFRRGASEPRLNKRPSLVGELHGELHGDKQVKEIPQSKVAALRKEFESISSPNASMTFTQVLLCPRPLGRLRPPRRLRPPASTPGARAGPVTRRASGRGGRSWSSSRRG